MADGNTSETNISMQGEDPPINLEAITPAMEQDNYDLKKEINEEKFERAQGRSKEKKKALEERTKLAMNAELTIANPIKNPVEQPFSTKSTDIKMLMRSANVNWDFRKVGPAAVQLLNAKYGSEVMTKPGTVPGNRDLAAAIQRLSENDRLEFFNALRDPTKVAALKAEAAIFRETRFDSTLERLNRHNLGIKEVADRYESKRNQMEAVERFLALKPRAKSLLFTIGDDLATLKSESGGLLHLVNTGDETNQTIITETISTVPDRPVTSAHFLKIAFDMRTFDLPDQIQDLMLVYCDARAAASAKILGELAARGSAGAKEILDFELQERNGNPDRGSAYTGLIHFINETGNQLPTTKTKAVKYSHATGEHIHMNLSRANEKLSDTEFAVVLAKSRTIALEKTREWMKSRSTIRVAAR